MEVIDIASAPDSRPTDSPTTPYEQCEQCGAPVDPTQRYCVACGAHRRHVHDPAMQHLATVTTRARSVRGRPSSGRGKRSTPVGAALVLAAIPLAVGLGILLGRASTSGDQKLIAALRAQKPEIITTGGGGVAATAAVPSATPRTTVSSISSDFPLQSGYAIELQTLPARGTDQATVTKAEHTAETKGAKSVGVIGQRDFRVTPSPPAGAYVLYSGAYRTKSTAAKELAKLARKFPAAKVIQVQGSGANSSTTGAGKVLARSIYGSAHQIAGSKPTASQLAAGGQAVARIQKQSGKTYINSQRGLPDQISVP